MSYCQQGNLPNSGSAVGEEPADLVTSSLGAEVAKIPEVEATSSPSEKINQKKV